MRNVINEIHLVTLRATYELAYDAFGNTKGILFDVDEAVVTHTESGMLVGVTLCVVILQRRTKYGGST